MKDILLKHITDDSSPDSFCFGICCEECQKIWYSRRVRFSKAGVESDTEGKKVIFDVLYRKEWNEALERACIQGREIFNLCPVCGRLVCNRCFMICEDLDMCSRCAGELETKGQPVQSEQAIL